MLRNGMVFFLLLALSFLVFGTVINGEVITVDDPHQLQQIEKRHAWNLERTFFRNKTTGLYYRPLITLSFTADKLLWNADPRMMRSVNIILHTLNAFLVFFLARFLFSGCIWRNTLSVISAVLFLWHPLTTESVNWISGRTDVLAATFVFSSAVSLLSFRAQRKWFYFLLAVGLLFCGVLAKETAIAFLAGFVFLLWARGNAHDLTFKGFFCRSGVLFLLLSIVSVTAWSCFFYLRELVLKDDSSRIALTLRVMDMDWGYTFFISMRALGFYLKKIFVPFPLNFAIYEVDPLYELLAILSLPLLYYLFVKRSLAGGYVLSGVALISPAFPIAFNQIAWTPFAERYVYISLGFVLPAFVYFVSELNLKNVVRFGVLVSLVLACGLVTFQRSVTWKTNEALWEDTVEKSPISQKAWNNYGVALQEQGRYEEAGKIFSIAASKTKFGYRDKYDINMAVSMMSRHDYNNAQQKLLEVLKLSSGTSNRALNVLLEVADAEAAHHDERISEVQSTLQRLAATTGKPGYYYQLGRLAKSLKQNEEAMCFFRKAYEVALDSDPVKEKAEKALNSLL
jgi:Tfp pilus assembly protein PilF